MPCFNAPARTTRHDTACHQPFTCALHDHPVLVQRQQRPHSDSAITDDGHSRSTLNPKSSADSNAPEVPSRMWSSAAATMAPAMAPKTTTQGSLPEICQKLRYT